MRKGEGGVNFTASLADQCVLIVIWPVVFVGMTGPNGVCVYALIFHLELVLVLTGFLTS